jgi:hypothetical protein
MGYAPCNNTSFKSNPSQRRNFQPLPMTLQTAVAVPSMYSCVPLPFFVTTTVCLALVWLLVLEITHHLLYHLQFPIAYFHSGAAMFIHCQCGDMREKYHYLQSI